MKQLAAQLDQWRGLLPAYLNWQEHWGGNFASVNHEMYGGSAYPRPVPDAHQNFFTADLDAPTATYPYAADIQAAVLRTRYYYVRYLVHRPFIFKALHHPEHMTHEDAEGVAVCLKSIMLWPITMSPVRGQKRLVPCLFFWSLNLLGVLLVLHLSQHAPILARIRANLLYDGFEADAKETTRLCIDWIRDLKDIDATALWCWTVLEEFHAMD
jgi:hypothetical protein